MEDVLHALQLQLRSWTILDWFIAASLTLSACAGFARGLIASLVSLLGIGLGVFAACIYTLRCARMLHGWVESPFAARLVSFFLILVTVYLLVAVAGRLLRSVSRIIGLGFLDRLAGAGFGVVRGILLLVALTLPLQSYLSHSVEGASSRLLPYLLQVSHGVSSVVPRHTRDQLSFGHFSL